MEFQKVSSIAARAHGRWYDDACGAAFAMELIGERWSLPVIRELMLGGRRFSDVRASLPGISAKVLTERLDSLESAGIVTRRTVGAPAPAKLYDLTDWGRGLERVMQELGRWSVQSPAFDPRLPLTPVSLMLSMRTMLLPDAVGDWRPEVRFEVGSDHFIGRLTDGELVIARSGPSGDQASRPAGGGSAGGGSAGDGEAAPALVFRAPTANGFLPVFYGKRPLGSDGTTLEWEGDKALAERFIALFALPARRGAEE